MTDTPDPVKRNENVKYKITVSNPGPDFGANVTMTDTLPPEATFVCATSSQGTCTGTSTVTCNLGPVQSNAQVTLMVKAPPSPPPSGQMTNTASVPYSADPNQSNNTAIEVTTVSQATPTPTSLMADIGVEITDSPDPVTVGQNLTYSISLHNFGPTLVPVTITDTLPANVQLVSVNSNQACCTGNPNITCYLGETFSNPVVTFVVTPTVAGPLSNTVRAQGNGLDQNLGNNEATATTTVLPAGGSSPTPTPTPSPTPVPPTPTPTPFCVIDTWSATSTTGAASSRGSHSAVWTGSEMIVWGGQVSTGPVVTNTGGRYDPMTNSWTATSTTSAPSARREHTAVWTGTEMIIWGGVPATVTGGRYNPSTNTWTATNTVNSPSSRFGHTAIWTGSEMIVWGGSGSGGAKYKPSTDTWSPTEVFNAPADRSGHTAVWTGTEMIIWGGSASGGARYNPSTNTWAPVTTVNAPANRSAHTAVWTGTEMIVWGGTGNLNTGGRYNPTTDSWTPTTVTNAPLGRNVHSAVWTSVEMVVWGGINSSSSCELEDGGRYNPTSDSWTPTTTVNAPHGRVIQTAVWTGRQMIVWGGSHGDVGCPDSLSPSPPARSAPTGVRLPNYLNSGGRYCAQSVPTPTPTPTATPSQPATHFEVIAPSEAFIFNPFNFTVRALDQFNNTATSYAGTVHFTTTSQNASLPPDHTLDNGFLTFGANIRTPGIHTITATDTVNPSITGTSNDILVRSDIPTPPPTPSATPTPTPTPSPTATPIASTPTPTSTPSPTPGSSPAQALNLATRLRVQSGDNAGIGGFILTGNAAKTVAIRGIGPSLAAFGLSDFLADPTLELRNSSGLLLESNDNWQEDLADATQLAANNLALQNLQESGIVATLPPGASYTAILAGKNQTAGVGLVEIYDIDQTAGSELANISTRGFVLTGNNVMIGGFILGGSNNTRIVVRGIGPSLAQFGLSPVLADPTLELHDSNGATLISNNDWQDDPASAAQLISFGLAPQNIKEAAIATSLPPGAFTGILAGNNGGTGIGLIEIYNVH